MYAPPYAKVNVWLLLSVYSKVPLPVEVMPSSAALNSGVVVSMCAFLTAFDLAGGLGDLSDLHGVTQSLAHGIHLLKGQFFAFVVYAVLVAGEALAQTICQLLVGERGA